MRAFSQHFLAVVCVAAITLMSGCSRSIESWIVTTRNHQGDLALDSSRYKDAVLAYHLALQISPTDEHAKRGFVEAEGDLAEHLYHQSYFEDALDELLHAAKVDPNSVRIAGLRTDVENARLKRQIVMSNYPTYSSASENIAQSYVNLRTTNSEILARIQRFNHTYDTNDLTMAIRNSVDLETEASKLTTRLVNLRSAVSVGFAAPDTTTGSATTAGASILPLP